MQALKKAIIVSVIALLPFVGGAAYGANYSRTNLAVSDYVRNIGYEVTLSGLQNETGFAAGQIPLFDSYRQGRKEIGQLYRMETAKIEITRTKGEKSWHYIKIDGATKGWAESDFYSLGVDYSSDHAADYIEDMFRRGAVNVQVLLDALEKSPNGKVRSSALRVLSEIDTPPEAERPIMKFIAASSVYGLHCFMEDGDGESAFKALGKIGGTWALEMMTSLFIDAVTRDSCGISEKYAVVLRETARTPEEMQFLKNALVPQYRLYKEYYDNSHDPGVYGILHNVPNNREKYRTVLSHLYQAMSQ